MKRTITCIVCPRGCTLTAENREGAIAVTGNACPRGEAHAVSECTDPLRSLTSILRVGNREDTMVSVKSAAPVPKGKLFAIMERIHQTTVQAPIRIGDVLIPNICGTDIVATKEIL